MIGYIPKRPTGNDPMSLFMQAVWDKLWGGETRVNTGRGAKVIRTTRGTHVLPEAEPGQAQPSNDCPYG